MKTTREQREIWRKSINKLELSSKTIGDYAFLRCLDDIEELESRIQQMRRDHQSELNESARSVADEQTWRQIQGDEYGSY